MSKKYPMPVPKCSIYTQAGCLVTGATGYIGSRLVPRLLENGYAVRCLARDATRLQGRPWRDEVEVVEGDVLDAESLVAAMRGISVAYYFVHSLATGADFSERDQQAALNFGNIAKKCGVSRIIYLGGLGDSSTELSAHLRSRQHTGDILRQSGVPVTEFRAGVIVGSGSISFEMIRYLTERVPLMICPLWVYTRIQPIAIRNVLDYLVEALHQPESTDRILEIGGADVMTYGEMLTFYAEVRGLYRLLIPVPVLTPHLSSYWVHFVTPIPASIARPLIEGLRNEVVVRNDDARRLFPQIMLLDYRTAVKLALDKLERHSVESAWSDALSTSQGDLQPVTLTTDEGMIIEKRQKSVVATPDAVFRVFSGLGGSRGWLYMDWAWRIRGIMDRICGGVGLRRGRRDAEDIRVGEALDFWRVEALEPGHLMRLRAEMKVPGKAWLQFEVKPQEGNSKALLTQTAFFAPKGLLGLAYWYLLYPLHGLIFAGMIRELGRRAEMLTPEAPRRNNPRSLSLLLGVLLIIGTLPSMRSAETLSQFSTIDALMQGIYDGPATFARVRQCGDFGIGTVNHLDGEMLGLDGVFYQVTSDGVVHLIPDGAKTSFATVSFFRGDHSSPMPESSSFTQLQKWLDGRLGSQNYFWSVRIHGMFRTIKVRSISRQHPPYRPLKEVAKTERIFEYRDVPGTLVGFRCPPYIKGINVPGYHFHFLSDDKTKGGHVLGCSLSKGTATWESHRTFQLQLPDDSTFRHADFSTHDAEGLRKAEQ